MSHSSRSGTAISESSEVNEVSIKIKYGVAAVV